jgi:hypothetical protein
MKPSALIALGIATALGFLVVELGTMAGAQEVAWFNSLSPDTSRLIRYGLFVLAILFLVAGSYRRKRNGKDHP